MSTSQAPRDLVLALLRQQLGSPELTYEQALDNPAASILFAAVEQMVDASSRATQAPKRTLAGFEHVPGVVKAAITDTFALDDIGVEPHIGDALVAASNVVMIDNARLLRLQDAERAGVIAANRGDSSAYASLLHDAIESDKLLRATLGTSAIESPAVWLRRFVSGEFPDLDTASPSALKAALAARERLRLVDDLPPAVPSIPDLSRRAGLADLLEPLRMLTGAEGGWGGRKRTDRFVGRDDELRRLRSFVDELSSQSATEFVSRATKAFVNVLTGGHSSGIMIVTARGGLGKSALLAKFVLDHALDQRRPFPFAYLDFDRAGIDPERPQQLLIEIARQVALQFPEAQAELQHLIDDLRATLLRPAETGDFSNPQEISDPFARFAEILREHITFGERAFLLVLDTLEIVQWNPTAMDKIVEVVDEFRRKGLTELRVVASGRADIPELRRARGADVPSESIQLKPLLVREARDLANYLGKATLGSAWLPDWARAIVGTASDDDARREPLAVRVATDLICRAAPPQREAVARQVASAGVGAADDFIARLYEKRILNHVRDERARRLAWPGLVVRRLTSEIVREVLAPNCGIAPEEADEAFRALGQEIWMVTREDAAGNVLRHRPDLRARTLPLMRSRDPVRFRKINLEVVAYFDRHQKRSLEDRGEWIYHRLLGGESIASIDAIVTDEVLPLLAKAEADFPADSPAASYLTSRTAHERLSPKRIRELQPVDALRHLRATSTSTFALDDNSIDRSDLDVADRVTPSEMPRGELVAWAEALWIKTGAWVKVRGETTFDGLPPPLLRMHLYWATRIGVPPNEPHRSSLLAKSLAAISAGPPVGLRSTVQAMALARFERSPSFAALDCEVARLLESTRPNPLPSMQAALRTAIVLGKACRKPALDLWLAVRRRGNYERVRTPGFSRGELNALLLIHPSAAERLGHDLGPDRPARFTDDRIVATAATILDDVIGDRQFDALSRMFGVRQEDWIMPLGYAAARAVSGVSPLLRERLTRYASNADQPTDMLGACRLADEAGDLPGFMDLVADAADDDNLNLLIGAFRNWCSLVRTEARIERPAESEGWVKLGSDAPTSPRSTPPPPPPPGPREDDPQKDRWGGQAERDGRAVRATLSSVERDIFYFSLIVESVDGSPLEAPVIFHLHDSYHQDVVPVTRIVDGKQASIRDLDAYGVYAVGVQVKDRNGRWTSLEFDLATLPRLPKRFLDE